jgi:Fe-S oxidoreductase
MGLIPWTARLAARAPGLANALVGAPAVAAVLKRAGGVAPQRRLPPFARPSFRDRLAARPRANPAGRPVILWPDTFTTSFEPEIGEAALEVLERCGCRVVVPDTWLCCGRPLYDFGMLPLAKRLLRRALRVLREPIAGGVPVVGLEPSCLAVFRDELVNLFPHDDDAQRLACQTFTLAEFLTGQAGDVALPRLERGALVQAHCHHKAVMGFDADQELMRQLGVDAEVLDSGCCGMAGSFGFEAGEHYDVSMKAAERVLLPAVRSADSDTLLVADGFSCRQQILQATGRRPLHLAEVARLALGGTGSRP